MKQKLTKLLCSVFLVAFAIPAIAQSSGGSSTRTITGKVTDSEGAPIIGAVVMASQREATTTNSEGRYTLAVQSPDAVLRFSCMGYRPRSENTAGRTVVDVSLETDNQLLEDVVVVGYGVQKKVNLTGSVASIDFSKTSESRSIISTSAALAGLAVYETCQDDARSIIDKAIESNASVMPEMYNPDGNYPEGYGYWGYGTAFECIMLAAMESCTGTDNGLSAVDGFKKTGKWILFMEGMNKMAFNYCDCAPSSIAFPPLWYLAHKFNDQSLLYGELMKLNDGRYTSYDSPKYFPMAIVYASKFDLNSIAPPEEKVWSGKGINPVVLVHGDWTFTDTDKFLGIKAGRANYSHGHMDVGSFVYDAWGTRWSADLGLQSYGTVENINLPGYTGGFGSYDQGAFRWAVFRYNNYNHSTITVNDALHRAGGRAKISSVINTSASKGATIDMTDILSSECESATRTVTLENDTDLVVKDIVKAKYNKAADVRWTMVTRAIPTVEGNRIVLQGASKKLYLKVTSQNNAKVTLKTWSTVGESYDASNAGYYEAGFETKVTSGQTDTFTVTLSPNE